MNRWEYLILKTKGNPEQMAQRFSEMGDDGWELVSVDNMNAYFKRMRPTITNTPSAPLQTQARGY